MGKITKNTRKYGNRALSDLEDIFYVIGVKND